MSRFVYLVLVIHLIDSSGDSIITVVSAARFEMITSCICPGYFVTYECTVMGGLGTVWRGSAINCMNGNGIFLLNNRFGPGYVKTCNNETISGRAIRVHDSFYTSQLSVKVSSDIIGEGIECIHDDDSSEVLIGSSIIKATAVPYPPPEKPSLSVVDLELKKITFNWSPVAPDCPAIHYNILSSNCGSCPTTTNYTTITCTDIPTDGSVCMFAVQTAVCGNITGNISDIAEGLFKAIVKPGCIGATASASVLAIGLAICVAAFTASILIILIKANKRVHNIELAMQRRTRMSIYEDVDHQQQPRATCTSDHQPSKEAVISTNKNIAYSTSLGQTSERVYAQIT